MKCLHNFLSESLKGGDPAEDLRVNEKIILEWIKQDGNTWTGFTWLRVGTSGGLL
jgi:hypothetical protein